MRLSSALFLFLFCLQSFAGPGEQQSPNFGRTTKMLGRNLEEKKVNWVWFNLQTFLFACYFADECNLSLNEQTLVQKILKNSRFYNLNTIQFVSGRLHPELFTSTLGETHRLASTGSTPQSAIYIDSDLVAEDFERPISFWAGLLVHELAHHTGVVDDANRTLDQLGAKFVKVYEQALITVNVPEESTDMQMVFVNLPKVINLQFVDSFPNGIAPFYMFKNKNDYFDAKIDDHFFDLKSECKNETRVFTHLSPRKIQSRPSSDDASITQIYIEAMGVAHCFQKQTLKTGTLTSIYKIYFLIQKSQGLPTIINGSIGLSWGEHFSSIDFEQLEMSKLSFNEEINAGETIQIAAQVTGAKFKKYKKCIVDIGNPDWPKMHNGSSRSINSDECKIQKQNDGSVEVTAKLGTSPQTRNMKLEIFYLCLSESVGSSASCDKVTPKKKASIRITNRNSTSEVKIKSYQIKRAQLLAVQEPFANYYSHPLGQTVDFIFNFDRPTKVLNSHIESLLFTTQNTALSYAGSLMKDPDNLLVHKVNNLESSIGFEISVPDKVENIPLKGIKFNDITFITEDLQVINVLFSKTEYGLFIDGRIE